jgi:competence protein ComFC
MLIDLMKALGNLLMPSLCFNCKKKTKNLILCKRCFKAISFLKPPLCRYCGKPLSAKKTNICQECHPEDFPFEAMFSVAAYREPLAGLIKLFKYGHYDYLSAFLGRLMAAHCTPLGLNPQASDLITSVPIHKYKLKERGYNQSGLLAQYLSKHFNIPLGDDIIGESANKPSQTKLSPKNRKLNVYEAFEPLKNIAGRNVLLIDDVYTTGATVSACCAALKKGGAGKITVLTLAKTL